MAISDNKKFIILQEDDKGFSYKNKKPSGYTKIEPKDSKLKIFYYIQNLDIESTYSLSLIVKNESKIEIISIGDIKADENGKIDVSYDFDDTLLESLCGSCICLKDMKGDVKYPLSGFLPKKKPFNWKVTQFRNIKNRPFRKENFSFDKKKETEVRKIEYHEVVENKDTIVSDSDVSENDLINNTEGDNNVYDYYQDVEHKEINKEDNESEDIKEGHQDTSDEHLFRIIESDSLNNTLNRGEFIMERYSKFQVREDVKHKSVDIYKKHEQKVENEVIKCKNNFEEAKKLIDSLKELMEYDDGKIEKMIKTLFPAMNKKDRNLDNDYNYRFFLNILSDYDEIKSLNQDNYRFFKVYIDNFSQMENMRKIDNVKYAIVYYPMLFLYPYFKDNGYFIIGINCDGENVSNLVYGVEAKHLDSREFPYDGKTGFNKYIYDYEHSKKYNIMEYDYKKFEVK